MAFNAFSAPLNIESPLSSPRLSLPPLPPVVQSRRHANLSFYASASRAVARAAQRALQSETRQLAQFSSFTTVSTNRSLASAHRRLSALSENFQSRAPEILTENTEAEIKREIREKIRPKQEKILESLKENDALIFESSQAALRQWEKLEISHALKSWENFLQEKQRKQKEMDFRQENLQKILENQDNINQQDKKREKRRNRKKGLSGESRPASGGNSPTAQQPEERKSSHVQFSPFSSPRQFSSPNSSFSSPRFSSPSETLRKNARAGRIFINFKQIRQLAALKNFIQKTTTNNPAQGLTSPQSSSAASPAAISYNFIGNSPSQPNSTKSSGKSPGPSKNQRNSPSPNYRLGVLLLPDKKSTNTAMMATGGNSFFFTRKFLFPDDEEEEEERKSSTTAGDEDEEEKSPHQRSYSIEESIEIPINNAGKEKLLVFLEISPFSSSSEFPMKSPRKSSPQNSIACQCEISIQMVRDRPGGEFSLHWCSLDWNRSLISSALVPAHHFPVQILMEAKFQPVYGNTPRGKQPFH